MNYVQETWVGESHRMHGTRMKTRYRVGKGDGLCAGKGESKGPYSTSVGVLVTRAAVNRTKVLREVRMQGV